MIRPSMRLDTKIPQETLLYEYVQGLFKHRAGRFGYVVDLGLLPPGSRTPRHMRLVNKYFDGLDDKLTGRIFRLSAGQVIGIYMGVGKSDLDVLKNNLFNTFSQESVILNEFKKPEGENRFFRYINVEQDYGDLLEVTRKLHEAGARAAMYINEPINSLDTKFAGLVSKGQSGADLRSLNKAAGQEGALSTNASKIKAAPENESAKGGVMGFLGPLMDKLRVTNNIRAYERDDLRAIIGRVDALDVGRMASFRRTYILGGDTINPVFEDIFIPYQTIMGDLFKTTDIGDMFWLNGYFHTQLNKKILRALPAIKRPDPAIARSLRMSIRSAMSEDFKSFLGFYLAEGGSFIAEFSVHDVLANPRWYVDVRKTLHKHGAKCCVGDMDAFSFLGLDRSFLVADFEKIRPGKTYGVFDQTEFKERLRQKIKKLGREKIIFTGCQSQEDLALGLSVGAHLFEGKFLDKMQGK